MWHNLPARRAGVAAAALAAAMSTAGTCNGGSASGPGPSRALVRAGQWGGDHVSLVVRTAGGTIEYDCARGTIDEPPVVDAAGAFDLAGTHVREGGPEREGGTQAGTIARFRGRVAGDRMELTVTIPRTGEVVGTFELRFGRPGVLRKCLALSSLRQRKQKPHDAQTPSAGSPSHA